MNMTIQNYKVYIKKDESENIIAVNSSAFLKNIDGWLEIDSGIGDKFHHAQNNYFSKPLMDSDGIYRYRFSDTDTDRQVIEKTQTELETEREKILLKRQKEQQIADLKSKLASTDYAVIKIAEGAATVEEYAEVISQREAWRNEINELESDI